MTASDAPRRSFATLAVNASACGAIATALWLLPASVHIVQWSSTPTRLALLLPAWQFAAALVAALLAAIAVTWRSPASRHILAPFNFLWLWAIPYLPWLPDRWPLLLVLAGPLRWIVPSLIAAYLVSGTSVWSRVAARVVGVNRTTIFLVSFAVYATAGVAAIRAHGIGGDEPHYLVITESLLRDGDLKIENNHQQHDYRAFFAGDLRPDYMQRGQNGEIYSIHAPGLSVLVLPVYAVAGHYGVAVFISLLAALCVVAMVDLMRALAGAAAANVAWIAIAFTIPFVPHAWAIFPELPGALVVAWAVKWLFEREERSCTTWLLRGVILATLPWLHTKFSVFVAIFGAALALRLWPRIKTGILFLTPMALSGLAWLYSFYVIYGRFDPEAPYGAYTQLYVLTSNIPHGLLGLLFDQKFGLLCYSPIYLTVGAGAWQLSKRREHRFAVAVLGLVVGAYVISTARLYMFWGGSSAPARFFVPLVPCLAPFVAVAIAHARSVFARTAIALWIAIGLIPSVAAMIWPRDLLFFSDPHGHARWLELLQGSSPLASVVPIFTDPDWAAHVVSLAIWLVVLSVATLSAWLVTRGRSASTWRSLVVGLLTLLAGGAVVHARPSIRVREETARRGDIDVLTRFDGTRFRTLDYSRWSRVTPDRLSALTTLEESPSEDHDEYVAGPYTLPPGRYDAQVWFTGSGSREGNVTVRALSQAVFGEARGALTNPMTVPFTLPVTIGRVMVSVTDAHTASAVSRVVIVPR
ncbi:MAG: hypothetical protein LBQ09_05090, partial [Acidobacteriaceae bacterium]|nr:hypothetical protein [Acidobacteriaceae bacterium]